MAKNSWRELLAKNFFSSLKFKYEDGMMIDTLKTSAVGITGSTTAQMMHWTEWVPPIFSALAALATLVYMLIKIYKEVK